MNIIIRIRFFFSSPPPYVLKVLVSLNTAGGGADFDLQKKKKQKMITPTKYDNNSRIIVRVFLFKRDISRALRLHFDRRP